MVIGNGVKNIQATAYNGARTVDIQPCCLFHAVQFLNALEYLPLILPMISSQLLWAFNQILISA